MSYRNDRQHFNLPDLYKKETGNKENRKVIHPISTDPRIERRL